MPVVGKLQDIGKKDAQELGVASNHFVAFCQQRFMASYESLNANLRLILLTQVYK
jgi:hypothetical protein